MSPASEKLILENQRAIMAMLIANNVYGTTAHYTQRDACAAQIISTSVRIAEIVRYAANLTDQSGDR